MDNMPIYNCQVTINSGTVFTEPAQYVQQKNIYERVTCFDLKYISHVKGTTKMYSIIKLFIYDENLAKSILENAHKGDKVTNITGRLVAGATPSGNKLSYIVVNKFELTKLEANTSHVAPSKVVSKESKALAKPDQTEIPQVQSQVQQTKAEQPDAVPVQQPAEAVKQTQAEPKVTETANAEVSTSTTAETVQKNNMVQQEAETTDGSDKLQKHLDSVVDADWF